MIPRLSSLEELQPREAFTLVLGKNSFMLFRFRTNYSRYNPKRHRREILINTGTRPQKQFTMKNGYPEMEMVGELRVFENPQDVEYFGNHRNFSKINTTNYFFRIKD